MTAPSTEGRSSILEERLRHLLSANDAAIRLGYRMMHTDGAQVFGVDLVALACIERSLSLVEGFVNMIRARNLLCAAPLLRLQVDSILRLHACWLVDKPHDLAAVLLSDTPLRKIRARDGVPMTDAYLGEKASERFPWIARVYTTTSGFVHLSRPHFLSSVSGIRDDGTMEMRIGTRRKWTDDQLIEAVEAFIEATKTLITLSAAWVHTKEVGGAEGPIGSVVRDLSRDELKEGEGS